MGDPIGSGTVYFFFFLGFFLGAFLGFALGFLGAAAPSPTSIDSCRPTFWSESEIMLCWLPALGSKSMQKTAQG